MSGGGGKKDVTTTTTTTPPAYLQQPLSNIASAATGEFNNAQGVGNQLTGQAQDLTSQTLQGNFLDPSTNPYLQSTFNRAADLTQTRLSSEFARNNRDLGAALPARSEELQTLSSNIFGQNYQQERDRQQGAIGQSVGLDPLNRYINQIAGVVPGAGGTNTSVQPYFKTGLF